MTASPPNLPSRGIRPPGRTSYAAPGSGAAVHCRFSKSGSLIIPNKSEGTTQSGPSSATTAFASLTANPETKRPPRSRARHAKSPSSSFTSNRYSNTSRVFHFPCSSVPYQFIISNRTGGSPPLGTSSLVLQYAHMRPVSGSGSRKCSKYSPRTALCEKRFNWRIVSGPMAATPASAGAPCSSLPSDAPRHSVLSTRRPILGWTCEPELPVACDPFFLLRSNPTASGRSWTQRGPLYLCPDCIRCMRASPTCPVGAIDRTGPWVACVRVWWRRGDPRKSSNSDIAAAASA